MGASTRTPSKIPNSRLRWSSSLPARIPKRKSKNKHKFSITWRLDDPRRFPRGTPPPRQSDGGSSPPDDEPETEWFPHNFFLRARDGEIVGGILGNVWAARLYVDFLWVDRSIRGKGHATRLMTAAEQRAIARGCAHSFLGAFSFQARPFYEKLVIACSVRSGTIPRATATIF
jgi:GNAT superfamily N-acetyltransferase